MKTSAELNELAQALCKAQGEMVGAAKASANPFFKSRYSDLSSVMEAIRAPFAAHGLCFVQGSSYADGLVTVTTRILHSSGQWIEDSLSLPVAKADAQGVGSALSYGKRYSLQSLSGVPSIDDDGEAAMQRKAPKPKAFQPMIESQMDDLLGLIDSTKTDLEKLCSAYGVNDVEGLSIAQADDAIAKLKRKLAK